LSILVYHEIEGSMYGLQKEERRSFSRGRLVCRGQPAFVGVDRRV